MSSSASPEKSSTGGLRRAILDDREAENHPLWIEDSSFAIPGSFLHEGLEVEVRRQSAGDIHVELRNCDSPWLVIELKSWQDLFASLRDKAEDRADPRMRHQLKGLLALRTAFGMTPMVMVVGMISPGGGNKRRKGVYMPNRTGKRQYYQQLSWAEGMGALLAIQHLGVMTTIAASMHDVPRAVRAAAELVERDTHFPQPGLPQVAGLAAPLTPLATTMTAVPTIGRKTATAIAQHFPSFPKFYEATAKELEEVDGVGKILAERVWAHFHGVPEPVKLINLFDPEYQP